MNITPMHTVSNRLGMRNRGRGDVSMTGPTQSADRGSEVRGYCVRTEKFDLVYADATPCQARGVAATLARTTSGR